MCIHWDYILAKIRNNGFWEHVQFNFGLMTATLKFIDIIFKKIINPKTISQIIPYLLSLIKIGAFIWTTVHLKNDGLPKKTLLKNYYKSEQFDIDFCWYIKTHYVVRKPVYLFYKMITYHVFIYHVFIMYDIFVFMDS